MGQEYSPRLREFEAARAPEPGSGRNGVSLGAAVAGALTVPDAKAVAELDGGGRRDLRNGGRRAGCCADGHGVVALARPELHAQRPDLRLGPSGRDRPGQRHRRRSRQPGTPASRRRRWGGLAILRLGRILVASNGRRADADHRCDRLRSRQPGHRVRRDRRGERVLPMGSRHPPIHRRGHSSFTLLAGAPFVGQGFFDLVVDPTNSARIFAATNGGVYRSVDSGCHVDQCGRIRVLGPFGGQARQPCRGPGGLRRRAPRQRTVAAASPSRTCRRPRPRGAGWPSRMPPHNRRSLTSGPRPVRPRTCTDAAVAVPAGGRHRQSQPTTPARRGTTGSAPLRRTIRTASTSGPSTSTGETKCKRLDMGEHRSRQTGDSIHPDQHAIAFDPSNPDTVYVGCDGGLYRSPNRGTNWQALCLGLGITEVEYLAQRFGTPHWLIGGTQDNGSMRHTGSLVWDHIADGDGGDCGVNRADPTRVYDSYYGMGMSPSRRTAIGVPSGGWVRTSPTPTRRSCTPRWK